MPPRPRGGRTRHQARRLPTNSPRALASRSAERLLKARIPMLKLPRAPAVDATQLQRNMLRFVASEGCRKRGIVGPGRWCDGHARYSRNIFLRSQGGSKRKYSESRRWWHTDGSLQTSFDTQSTLEKYKVQSVRNPRHVCYQLPLIQTRLNKDTSVPLLPARYRRCCCMQLALFRFH